jgi:hypothetical protein
MIDKKLFAAGMYTLGACFQVELTDAMVEAYYQALSFLDDEAWSTAVRDTTLRAKWFPKPAELLERCGLGAEIGVGSENATLLDLAIRFAPYGCDAALLRLARAGPDIDQFAQTLDVGLDDLADTCGDVPPTAMRVLLAHFFRREKAGLEAKRQDLLSGHRLLLAHGVGIKTVEEGR